MTKYKILERIKGGSVGHWTHVVYNKHVPKSKKIVRTDLTKERAARLCEKHNTKILKDATE